MMTYNLTEKQVQKICSENYIHDYFKKFNATFDWNHDAVEGDPNFWGTAIFERDEDLTWFLLNI